MVDTRNEKIITGEMGRLKNLKLFVGSTKYIKRARIIY